MITVDEVIGDPDMVAPQPFAIQRYVGQFVAGGFQNTLLATFQQFGPVRNATDEEIHMLPESDRTSQVRAFYALTPVLIARGVAPAGGTHGEVPQGAVPGTTYTLSVAPPGGIGQLTINGIFQRPGADYAFSTSTTIELTVSTSLGDGLWFQWPVEVFVAQAESDIILYNGEQYRVLDVYRTEGSGYWKALGTRMATS